MAPDQQLVSFQSPVGVGLKHFIKFMGARCTPFTNSQSYATALPPSGIEIFQHCSAQPKIWLNILGHFSRSQKSNTVEPGISKLFQKHKKFTIARCLLLKGFDQNSNMGITLISYTSCQVRPPLKGYKGCNCTPQFLWKT